MSEHVTDWIAAYHDSELDAARLSQVESHLLECPACRAELEALKALSTMLQMSPTMPVRTSPERLWPRCGYALDRLSPPRPNRGDGKQVGCSHP